MSTEHPEHTDHIEHATIQVNEAEVTPASRTQARLLAYSLCVLFIFMIGIGAANLLFTSSQVQEVRSVSAGLAQANARLARQITGDCGFYGDLAGLPLATAPNGHPSELGVKIISDSRVAWVGHGCRGKLPPPNPTFVAGAAYYHLPVVRAGE
jgi:hypothetical protein